MTGRVGGAIKDPYKAMYSGQANAPLMHGRGAGRRSQKQVPSTLLHFLRCTFVSLPPHMYTEVEFIIRERYFLPY